MTLYCCHPSCLHKNEYQGVRPKCCSECGTPFDAAFKRLPLIAPIASVASTTHTLPPVQQVSQPPRPHVGSFHQQRYEPRPEQPTFEIDASSFTVETDRPEKITMGQAIKMGPVGESARQPRTQGVNVEGSTNFTSFQTTVFNEMLASKSELPTPQPEPARTTRPARRSKRSK